MDRDLLKSMLAGLSDDDTILAMRLLGTVYTHHKGDYARALDKLRRPDNVLEYQLRAKLRRAEEAARISEEARRDLVEDTIRALEDLALEEDSTDCEGTGS